MGIATYDFVEDNETLNKLFDSCDLTFLIIFTIECALQVAYHGYQIFYDAWLTFDFIIVVTSWTLSGAQVFRAFRGKLSFVHSRVTNKYIVLPAFSYLWYILTLFLLSAFRAFRLVARLTVLKVLVNAIIAVLPRLASIMLLFSLVLYIYSVLCTILFGDVSDIYFGSLYLSLFTLFQFVTLDGWGEIAREVKEDYEWANAVFLSFLTISSFILYSLVVAVVCDAVAVVEQ